MASKPDSEYEEEYFDCITDVRYCAIASPKGQGTGEVFVDFGKARAKWKQLKGSRMKIFDNYGAAQTFANTPIEQTTFENTYPPSPKADVEATPFSSVPQGQLVKFRGFIERGDLNNIRTAVQDNPMSLVTSSDTPTLLQIRLRYNALHVAAAAGNADTIELLLSYLNSPDFWRRIYPGTDDATARDRQWHVTDLYLNSPELGNLETPIHFASKFGHITCVRLLAVHPLTQLNVCNRAGETPADLAASRMSDGNRSNGLVDCDLAARSVLVSHPIRRLLAEHFVLLADVRTTKLVGAEKTTILPPLLFHQFQSLLARLPFPPTPGLLSLFPFLPVECSRLEASNEDSDNRAFQVDLDLGQLGLDVHLVALRGFAGPMTREEAVVFRSKWLKANSSTSFKTFASVRLSDPEKGYERQGRHLSRIAGTRWHEYWSFLNDYLDLASEHGLTVLENHMKEHSSLFKLRSYHRNRLSNEHLLHQPSDTNNVSGESLHQKPAAADSHIDFDEAAPGTPIRRPKIGLSDHTATESVYDPWTSYRSNCAELNVLNDTLEECSDRSELQTSIQDDTFEDDKLVNNGAPATSHLTPILSLFQRLTFASPLRWLLVDSPGGREPLFSPESVIPNYKKVVKVHSPHPSVGTIPGKRRMSAVDPEAPKADEQPLPKKPSPKKSREPSSAYRVKVPLHFKHVYRALPAGDPELETAVTVLNCVEQSNVSSHYPRILSLSRFPAVGAWKKQIEIALSFSENPHNL